VTYEDVLQRALFSDDAQTTIHALAIAARALRLATVGIEQRFAFRSLTARPYRRRCNAGHAKEVAVLRDITAPASCVADRRVDESRQRTTDQRFVVALGLDQRGVRLRPSTPEEQSS
jgi:hypothetical protein